jgi:hypothetical protein
MTSRHDDANSVPADNGQAWTRHGFSYTELWVTCQLTRLLKHGDRVLHNAIPQMDDSAFTIKCSSSSRQPPLTPYSTRPRKRTQVTQTCSLRQSRWWRISPTSTDFTRQCWQLTDFTSIFDNVQLTAFNANFTVFFHPNIQFGYVRWKKYPIVPTAFNFKTC